MDEHRQETENKELDSSIGKKHRKYQTYDETFKRDAVRLSQQPGRTVAAVARSLGINVNTLMNWRQTFGATSPAPAAPKPTPTAEEQLALQQRELMELRKRLLEAEQERDILKKALVVFSRPPR